MYNRRFQNGLSNTYYRVRSSTLLARRSIKFGIGRTQPSGFGIGLGPDYLLTTDGSPFAKEKNSFKLACDVGR